MSKFLRKNANPSLLDLLKMGCCVEFNDERGVKFIGDILNGYVECYNVFGYVGCFDLSKAGLSKALADKDVWCSLRDEDLDI